MAPKYADSRIDQISDPQRKRQKLLMRLRWVRHWGDTDSQFNCRREDTKLVIGAIPSGDVLAMLQRCKEIETSLETLAMIYDTSDWFCRPTIGS